MKKSAREKELEKILREIALLGYGIKEEVRDWGNIGRQAVGRARDALAGKCKECGRWKAFQ